MVTSGVGVVLCRLAAVYFALQAIGFSALLFQQHQLLSESTTNYSEVAIGSVLVPLFVSALVWGFAERISSFKGPAAEVQPTEDSDSKRLVVIGTFLIGLCFVLVGVEGAVRREVLYWTLDALNRGASIPEGEVMLQRLPERLSYILQMVLGVLLIAGKDMLPRFYRWARYAGTGAS